MAITLDLTVPQEIYTEIQTDAVITAAGHDFAMLDWGDGECRIVDAAGKEISGAAKKSAVNMLRNVIVSQAGLTGSALRDILTEETAEGITPRGSSITAVYYLGSGYIAAFSSTNAYLYKLDSDSKTITLLASAACSGTLLPMSSGSFLTYSVVSLNSSSPSVSYTAIRFDTVSEDVTAVSGTQSNANCLCFGGSSSSADFLITAKGYYYNSSDYSVYAGEGKVACIRIDKLSGVISSTETAANYNIGVISGGDGEWFIGSEQYSYNSYPVSPYSIHLNKETGTVSVSQYGDKSGNGQYGRRFSRAVKTGNDFLCCDPDYWFPVQISGDGSMTVGESKSGFPNIADSGDGEWFLSAHEFSSSVYLLRYANGLLTSNSVTTSGLPYRRGIISAGDGYFISWHPTNSNSTSYYIGALKMNFTAPSATVITASAVNSAVLYAIDAVIPVAGEWFIGVSSSQPCRIIRLNKTGNQLLVYPAPAPAAALTEINLGKYLTFAAGSFSMISLAASNPVAALPDSLFVNG